MEQTFFQPEYGYQAIVHKFAGQADGAVWLQQGGTVVIAAVVSEASEEFPGFFPLSVEYREQFSSVGRIPGGYFKREGKPSDKEVLTSRLVDRTIRPLFPEAYFDKVQVSLTVYSFDKQFMPPTLALLATSISLSMSNIPFIGPVGACEVARVNGEVIFNPTQDQTVNSDLRIVVAGNEEGVNMVEGSAKNLSEEQFVDILFQAHEVIKRQIAWQKEILAQLKVGKKSVEDTFGLQTWQEKAEAFLTEERVQRLFVADKVERGAAQDSLREEFFGHYAQALADGAVSKSFIAYVYDAVLQKALTEQIFKRGHRLDNRDFETIRPISSEVGLLPCTHGSALFRRGRTQLLASATLGGGQDEARVETLMGYEDNSFMLNYNFPAFSVGEARASRGPGRREVGHGHLAASAIKPVLPSNEAFPYTIRVVADVLECDGSSSMATVCSSILALMDAGVPVADMVGGVAMGLLMNKDGDIRILTDIAGIEDAFGLMDFKVAGTERGITAIQMDIKYKGGLPREIFVKALEQARRGRLHILGEMRKTLTEPRESLSPLVPQFVTFKIPKDKIGAVIGKGGEVIRGIIDATATTIDIEDDGTVVIFGTPGDLLDKAVQWVKLIAGDVQVGSRHRGQVKRSAEFGYFVDLVPGLAGLVHVSTVSRRDQEAFMKRYKENDVVDVEVLDYDPATGRIRLKIID